jgi:hypothetical protein
VVMNGGLDKSPGCSRGTVYFYKGN